MSALSIVEIVLALVLLPLTVATLIVLIDEGASARRDARWLSRRS